MAPEKTEMQKVLIVDDDRKLTRLLGDYLSPMGYEIEVAYAGPEGLERALSGKFRAVILDVMLPGMNGFEVLRHLRQSSDVPVLMLTARGEETDRVVGLEMGADDYLPKPFSPRELLARLRAITRRYASSPKPEEAEIAGVVEVGDLRIDPGARTASLSGKALGLTSLEFDLLYRLAQNAGRVLDRDQLLDSVMGRDYEVFDRSIDVHVSSLRKKLGDDPRRQSFIKTVRGVGYLFVRDADGET